MVKIQSSLKVTYYELIVIKQKEGLKTTAWTGHVLNAMALVNSLEHAGLYLYNGMQMFIDADDNLDV